ncbi:hypothetical protein ACWEEL_34380, partial [Streptomyces sp. NPDC005009]
SQILRIQCLVCPGSRVKAPVYDLDTDVVVQAEPTADLAAATGLLPPPVLAHTALLAELAHMVSGVGVDQLAFAARISTTEPDAAGVLAEFLTVL